MKIILLQDVPKLGNKYSVKEVSGGHARNFLIPRGLAEVATEKGIKLIEIKKKQTGEKEKISQDILEKNLAELEGLKISIEEKANEKGHLFAGVPKEEIAKILKEQKHIEIPAELIDLEQPIKEAGEHKILVRPSGSPRFGEAGGKAKGKEFILEIKAK